MMCSLRLGCSRGCCICVLLVKPRKEVRWSDRLHLVMRVMKAAAQRMTLMVITSMTSMEVGLHLCAMQ